MVVMMGGMGWMMRRAGSRGPGSSEDPVWVLKTRYARGELTTEEAASQAGRRLEGSCRRPRLGQSRDYRQVHRLHRHLRLPLHILEHEDNRLMGNMRIG